MTAAAAPPPPPARARAAAGGVLQAAREARRRLDALLGDAPAAVARAEELAGDAGRDFWAPRAAACDAMRQLLGAAAEAPAPAELRGRLVAACAPALAACAAEDHHKVASSAAEALLAAAEAAPDLRAAALLLPPLALHLGGASRRCAEAAEEGMAALRRRLAPEQLAHGLAAAAARPPAELFPAAPGARQALLARRAKAGALEQLPLVLPDCGRCFADEEAALAPLLSRLAAAAAAAAEDEAAARAKAAALGALAALWLRNRGACEAAAARLPMEHRRALALALHRRGDEAAAEAVLRGGRQAPPPGTPPGEPPAAPGEPPRAPLQALPVNGDDGAGGERPRPAGAKATALGGAAGDAGAAAEEGGLAGVVARLSDEGIKRRVGARVREVHTLVKELERARGGGPAAAEARRFGAAVLVLLLEALRDSGSDHLRYMAAKGVTALCRAEAAAGAPSELLRQHMAPAMGKLLACAEDATFQVVTRAEEAMLALLASQGADDALAIAVAQLARLAGGGDAAVPKVLLLLRAAKRLVGGASSGVVVRGVQELSASAAGEGGSALAFLLLHPQLELRKHAVDMCVECYGVIGDRLLPFLAILPADRLKLITLYVQKKAQQRRGAAALRAAT